jgi:hypothetical protein
LGKIAVGFITAAVLAACGGGGGSDTPGPVPTAEQWIIVTTDTGNNIQVFQASASSPVQTPIPQLGNTINVTANGLGEIHFANGKAFVTITTGRTDGPLGLESGALAVVDVATQQVEDLVILESALTGNQSRAVHVYLDPEAKYLWVNNDGPSTPARPTNYADCALPGAPVTCHPDSVFRVNVDPTDPDYLDYTEIVVGDGHKKSAFSRPHGTNGAWKTFMTSSLSERRIDVIDDDPTHATYGQVIKTIRNVGGSPHGMDYSPLSGRAFAGITGGGVVSIDATQLDLGGDDTVDIPDVDCAPGGTSVADDFCVATGTTTPDPSVYKLTTGMTPNDTLLAGYVHVYTNSHGDEDMVYTTGRSNALAKGYLNAIEPGAGSVLPEVVAVVDLGDMGASSFDFLEGGTKMYVPSNSSGSVKNVVRVIDIDHDSPLTYHTILRSITVGDAGGDRNGEISPDGRLVVYPNNCTAPTGCNSVNVIDAQTDTVIDTLALTTGTAGRTVGVIRLPFDAADNH